MPYLPPRGPADQGAFTRPEGKAHPIPVALHLTDDALCRIQAGLDKPSGNSQGGVQFPTGGIARERLGETDVSLGDSRSGVTPGPTV